MQHLLECRLAPMGLTAVLLFGMATPPAAAQVRRAPPRPAIPQPPPAEPAPAPPPVIQRQPMPASEAAGVAQLTPAARCGSDTPPHIGDVNGSQSGAVFQPGSQLNISGCGFGSAGQVFLSAGVGVAVPLIVDQWEAYNIRAHIDSALGGTMDKGVLNVHVTPEGGPELASAGMSSFRAARETVQAPLPPALGIYSPVYGAPKRSISAAGKSTIVERRKTYTPFCPAQKDQSGMVDYWPIPDGVFNPGFEVVGVTYTNMTGQLQLDDFQEQSVLVGDNGRAQYEALKKRFGVTFQGHAEYFKKSVGVGDNGYSICTSRYSVFITVRGPRGVAPFK